MRVSRRQACGLLISVALQILATAALASAPALTLKEDLVIGLDSAVPIGYIQDVCVDSDGSIYVLDSGFMTVRKFDKSGVYLGDLSGEGEGPGEFYSPACMAIDPDGVIHVAGGTSVIAAFDREGEPRDSIKLRTAARPRSMRFDGSGNLYLAAFDLFDQYVIHKYSGDHGGYERSFCKSYADGKDVDVRVETVFAGGLLDIGPEGSVYFAQLTPQAVRKYSPDGELIWERESNREGIATPSPKPVDVPGGGQQVFLVPISSSMLVFSDARYLVSLSCPKTEGENAYTIVDLFDPNGTLLGTARMNGGFSAKCKDRDGRIYVTDWRKPNEDSEDSMQVLVRYSVSIAE